MTRSAGIFARLLLCVLLGTGAAAYVDRGHVLLISVDGLAAYHLENSELLLPNIRTLIRQGVWAESSETVFPSITHPSHTTMITGVPPRVHGVVGNNLRNRLTGVSFHVTNLPRAESISATTLFDAAKKKNLVTASFFWPETKSDPSVDFNIPEAFDAAARPDLGSVAPDLLQELRSAGVPIDLYHRWYGELSLKGAADSVLTQAAAHVIRTRKPQFLAIHLLVTDSTQHTYGPDHYLSSAALTTADYNVGVLLQAVKDAGIMDKTTFFVVADHGFHSVRYETNLHPLFKDSGLLDRVALHPGGWTMFVELKENFNRAEDMHTLQKVLDRAKTLEGVSRIVPPEEFHDLGLPRYEENPHIAGEYMILGDIDTHLVARDSSGSTRRMLKSSPSHGHGYLPSHPRMYPAFVVSGYRIKKGVRIGHISNYVIAPTISHLLDLGMTGFTGRVLSEALSE